MSAFHEVSLPLPFALGASGGPERRVDVVALASGAEARNTPWAHGRRRYDIGGAVRTLDELHTLIAFFESRRGKLHGFRFRDPFDFKSCAPSQAITPLDQEIGVGDGAETTFQLVKRYGSGESAYLRPIAKPIAASVRIAIDGVELASGAFEVNSATGAVTLDEAPDEGVVITAGFQCETPVRFDLDRLDLSLDGFGAGRALAVPLIEIPTLVRAIPEALVERLASGVTTLAHVWMIVRRDGAAFGFTDHDQPLAFDELVCDPVQGLAAGAIEKSAGLNVDSASILGALNADAITENDLARGLWDGARVDIYRVDWSEPSLRVHLFAGRIGEVRRGAQAFEAELRGLRAQLNVAVGRVFSRFCDADLGDARCGKDIEAPAFRGEGVVSEVLVNGAFRADGLEAFAEGWFARGRLVWDDGGESEIAAHRLDDGDALLELLDSAGPALSVGATFVVYAGCDKRFETCRARFDNTVNFRGFPHMPGNDVLQAGPSDAAPMDGSSRFT